MIDKLCISTQNSMFFLLMWIVTAIFLILRIKENLFLKETLNKVWGIVKNETNAL